MIYILYFQNQWGGEYYTSLVDSAPVSNVTLQCNQFGDFDSLSWVEATENNEPGLKVKVYLQLKKLTQKLIDRFSAFEQVIILDGCYKKILFQVHYAGISYNDIKKAGGALSFGQNVINDYGMDFSGTTER